jgi:hypothetical protein
MNTHTLTYRTTIHRKSHSRSSQVAHTAVRVLGNADNRLKMAQGLIVICTILGIFYAINLYSIISNTVALQHIGKETRALTSEVEALDTQYLKLSSKITPDALKTYGLGTGEVSFFIPRTSSLGSVATAGHEL